MNDDLEKFFSAIDSVPWPRIEHAFGPATDVPDLIRGLTSPDVNVQNDAWSKLWHQGTIYEATSYAVPVSWSCSSSPRRLASTTSSLFSLSRLLRDPIGMFISIRRCSSRRSESRGSNRGWNRS